MGCDSKRKANPANPTRERHDPAHAAVERNADSGCDAARKGAAGGSRRHVGPSQRGAAAGGLSAVLCVRERAAACATSTGANTSISCAVGDRCCSAIGIRRSRRRPRRRPPRRLPERSGEVMVELAEDLVAMLPHADWAMFQKNGGDATTSCVTIARAGTGRRKVLVARGSLSRRAAMVLAERGRRDGRGPRASAALRVQRRREPASRPSRRRARISPRSW